MINDISIKISDAFSETQYPGDASIVTKGRFFFRDEERMAFHRAITGMQRESLSSSQIAQFADSLVLLKPLGFRYYIPTFLIAAIDSSTPHGVRWLIYSSLLPPRNPSVKGRFPGYIAVFNRKHREVIAEALEWLVREYPALLAFPEDKESMKLWSMV